MAWNNNVQVADIADTVTDVVVTTQRNQRKENGHSSRKSQMACSDRRTPSPRPIIDGTIHCIQEEKTLEYAVDVMLQKHQRQLSPRAKPIHIQNGGTGDGTSPCVDWDESLEVASRDSCSTISSAADLPENTMWFGKVLKDAEDPSIVLPIEICFQKTNPMFPTAMPGIRKPHKFLPDPMTVSDFYGDDDGEIIFVPTDQNTIIPTVTGTTDPRTQSHEHEEDAVGTSQEVQQWKDILKEERRQRGEIALRTIDSLVVNVDRESFSYTLSDFDNNGISRVGESAMNRCSFESFACSTTYEEENMLDISSVARQSVFTASYTKNTRAPTRTTRTTTLTNKTMTTRLETRNHHGKNPGLYRLPSCGLDRMELPLRNCKPSCQPTLRVTRVEI